MIRSLVGHPDTVSNCWCLWWVPNLQLYLLNHDLRVWLDVGQGAVSVKGNSYLRERYNRAVKEADPLVKNWWIFDRHSFELVFIVKIDVKLMIVSLQDTEAISYVLADSAGHVSLRRIKIRVRIVRRNSISFVNWYLIEEESIDEVRRNSVNLVLRKEQLSPIRNHDLFYSLQSHVLVKRFSNVGPVLNTVDLRQDIVVERTVDVATNLYIASSFLQELIVDRLHLDLQTNRHEYYEGDG